MTDTQKLGILKQMLIETAPDIIKGSTKKYGYGPEEITKYEEYELSLVGLIDVVIGEKGINALYLHMSVELRDALKHFIESNIEQLIEAGIAKKADFE